MPGPRTGPGGTATEPASAYPQTHTLDSLYRQHSAFVARLAFRLLGAEADVDDVVHDVFFDLMRQLNSLENPAELRGWLGVVTVRAVRRRLRRARWRMWIGLGTSPEHEEIAAPTATPEQGALLAAIYRALDGLPTDERLAWTLRHIEGETLEEVAARCEVSLATTKRKLVAANGRLRKALGEWTNL